jgi:sugar lactone lactonase YvrE
MKQLDFLVSPLPGSQSQLGESPFWHPDEAALWWCDIPGRRLSRADGAQRTVRHWELPAEPGCAAPLPGGELLLALRDGLWRFEPRSPARAALYRFDAAGLVRMADGATVSNGLAFSPDGRTLYWSDTTSHTVFAFDFDLAQGTLSRQRVLARFPRREPQQPLADYGGRPDGAAVDAEGCYWVAMFEGARLLRLSPSGEALAELRLPVRCPTMPCFGGADLRTLYVTTARAHRPADELAGEPWAGCVLQCRVDVPGLPVNFAHLP